MRLLPAPVSDPRGAARVPGERDAGRGDLHRARQAEDRDGHRRGVRAQAPGQDAVRVRVLMDLIIVLILYKLLHYTQ